MDDHHYRKNTQQTQVSTGFNGKIFKGVINDAPMKVRVASIPSKLQMVIYRNNKQPAFGNSISRFYNQLQNAKKSQPGPGEYDNSLKGQQKIFSKKGLGTFASNSKLQRLQINYDRLPGPASYNPNGKLLSKAKRSSSLALISSKIQGHQLFKTQLEKSKWQPGPGVYETKQHRSNSFSHIFDNKVPRFDQSGHKNQVPAVGHYQYQDSSIKKIPNKQYQTHYKKSDPTADDINEQQKLKIVRQVLTNSNPKKIGNENSIGPGSYQPSPIDRKIGFKIHESNINRFGQTQKKKKSPNSSITKLISIFQTFQTDEIQTQPVDHKQRLKLDKGLTSMFKSNIARYDFIQANASDPGKYLPQKPDKKSYIVNFEKKWI